MKKALLIATILSVGVSANAFAREDFYNVRRAANPSVIVDLSVLDNLKEQPQEPKKESKKSKAAKKSKTAASGINFVENPEPTQPENYYGSQVVSAANQPQSRNYTLVAPASPMQNITQQPAFVQQPVQTYSAVPSNAAPQQNYANMVPQFNTSLNTPAPRPEDYVSNTSVTIKSNTPAVAIPQKVIPTVPDLSESSNQSAPIAIPQMPEIKADIASTPPKPKLEQPKPTPKIAAPAPSLPKPALVSPAPIIAAPKLAPAPTKAIVPIAPPAPPAPPKTLAAAKPSNSLPPLPPKAATSDDVIMIPATPPAPPPLPAALQSPKSDTATASLPQLPNSSSFKTPAVEKPSLPALPPLPTLPAPPKLATLSEQPSAANLETPKIAIPTTNNVPPPPKQLLKDITKPDISAVASAPSEINPALTVTAPNVSIIYSEAETELPLSEQAKLQAIASAMSKDKSKVLNIIAFASGAADQAGAATRTSLARGLAVRRFFLDRNIDRERINVRPLGNKSTDGVPDRVDIFLDNSSKG